MTSKGSSENVQSSGPSQDSAASNPNQSNKHPTSPTPSASSSSPPFKRKHTFPPTPHVNGQFRFQPAEESSPYFDAAMSRTPTTHSPLRPPLDLPEESGDPMFDLDEDLDSPVEKYEDEKGADKVSQRSLTGKLVAQ